MQPLWAGDETIPVYDFPEQAARALGKTAAYAVWRNTEAGVYVSFEDLQIKQARNLCRQVAQARGETWLTATELHQLLQAADLRLAPGVLSHSADDAAALARVFGFPVVAKLVSAKAVHKTQVGGVRLHLTNEKDVRGAYAELSGIANAKLGGDLDGILIQPMTTSGTETLVGLTQDSTFGPLIAFGLGGVYVGVFLDVAFRIAPLTDRDADELLRSVRGFTLLARLPESAARRHSRASGCAAEDFVSRRSYSGAARAGIQSGDGAAGRSRLSDRRRTGKGWSRLRRDRYVVFGFPVDVFMFEGPKAPILRTRTKVRSILRTCLVAQRAMPVLVCAGEIQTPAGDELPRAARHRPMIDSGHGKV